MTLPETSACSGCGQPAGYLPLSLMMVDQEAGTRWQLAFCTPRCAYEWWRQMLSEDYEENIEPDLLAVVASDLFDALEGFEDFRQASDQQLAEISECWARLGFVLRRLDPRPPEVR